MLRVEKVRLYIVVVVVVVFAVTEVATVAAQ
jgi:hypothetical protein